MKCNLFLARDYKHLQKWRSERRGEEKRRVGQETGRNAGGEASMGWFGGGKKKEDEKVEADVAPKKEEVSTVGGGGLKGESVEVLRPEPTGPLPTDVSVFEFGTAGADGDEKLTLAGYCPVSDEMEPCRWEVFPAGQAEAPGFRILF